MRLLLLMIFFISTQARATKTCDYIDYILHLRNAVLQANSVPQVQGDFNKFDKNVVLVVDYLFSVRDRLTDPRNDPTVLGVLNNAGFDARSPDRLESLSLLIKQVVLAKKDLGLLLRAEYVNDSILMQLSPQTRDGHGVWPINIFKLGDFNTLVAKFSQVPSTATGITKSNADFAGSLVSFESRIQTQLDIMAHALHFYEMNLWQPFDEQVERGREAARLGLGVAIDADTVMKTLKRHIDFLNGIKLDFDQALTELLGSLPHPSATFRDRVRVRRQALLHSGRLGDLEKLHTFQLRRVSEKFDFMQDLLRKYSAQ